MYPLASVAPPIHDGRSAARAGRSHGRRCESLLCLGTLGVLLLTLLLTGDVRYVNVLTLVVRSCLSYAALDV